MTSDLYILFIPKHQIDRHSVHLHARVVILKLQSDFTNLCVTSAIVQRQACNKRLRNDCIP